MDDIGPGLKISWSVATVLSMIFELMTVVKATRERARARGGRVTSASLSVQPRPSPPQAMQLSIMAPGLALRGPEGSMTRALVTMRAEYRKVHAYFYAGLFFFHISVHI